MYDKLCIILFLIYKTIKHTVFPESRVFIKETNCSSNCAIIDNIYSFCMPTVYDFLTSNVQELLTKLFYQIINECSVKK